MNEPTPLVDRPTPPMQWLIGAAFAGALVAALLFSSQIYFSMLDHEHDWWRIVLWQGVLWGFWATVSPWVFRAGVELLHPHSRPRLWLVRLVGLGGVLTVVHLLLGAFALVVVDPYVPVVTYDYSQALDRTWSAWAGVSPVVFAVLVAIGYGVGGFWAARRREVRASLLEAELAKAQLHALRLEIQPHFLFNTLNSIAALVRRQENDKALEMLIKLSDLLRSTLEHSGGPLVTLRDELEFVKCYLDLQSIRFSDRLRVEYDIDDAALDRETPFLLLQPLAENAIRHGLARTTGRGNIEIGATVSNGSLVLTVSDDGPGLPEGFDIEKVEGVGLSNTRSRLMKLYRERSASITVDDRAGGGTVARVEIPSNYVAEASPA